ncbi:type IV pilin protein [Patescibacteria group bacterium]
MRYKYIKSIGFTMIELLVVISIIGILATLFLANYNAARTRARDAQRKADLRNIQTALRLYYNDNVGYPASSVGQIVGCGGATPAACGWGAEAFIRNGVTYMSTLSADPQSPDQDYIYNQTGIDTYTLVACLENASDDSCDDPVVNCINGTHGCEYTVMP